MTTVCDVSAPIVVDVVDVEGTKAGRETRLRHAQCNICCRDVNGQHHPSSYNSDDERYRHDRDDQLGPG